MTIPVEDREFFKRLSSAISNHWEVAYLNTQLAPDNGYVHFDETIYTLAGLIADRNDADGTHALYGFSAQTPLEERLADAIIKHR